MTKLKFVTLAFIGCSLGFFVSIDVTRVVPFQNFCSGLALTISTLRVARIGDAGLRAEEKRQCFPHREET